MVKTIACGSCSQKRKQQPGSLRNLIRIFIVFTLAVAITLQLNAKSYAQNVTLHLRNVPLKEAFKRIKEQTGYSFFWREQLLTRIPSITVNVSNASIGEALNACIGSLPLSYRIQGKIVYILSKTELVSSSNETAQAAQLQPIQGRVTDSTGTPLAGVSVVVENTSNGTVTNTNGEYRINANTGEVLVFSFVGYESQKVTVTASEVVNVQLVSSETVLSDLVVVAYGTQKRVNLSGAVNTLNTAQVTNRPVTSLTNSLQGLIPGMVILSRPGDVGNDMGNINVRGRGNLGTAAPFYVVDGVPVTAGDFARINPADVESMSVLKDASAASLYGSRAANGVILVTTKRGKSGKAAVNYNGYYGIQKPTVLPRWLGSYDYALLSNEASVNTGGAPVYNSEQLEKISKQSSIDSFPNTDWYALALQSSAPITEHQVNVSGGNTVRYYFSGAYFKQGSLIPDKDLSRYSFRSNVEAQLSEKFKIGSNISYIRDNIKSESGPLSFLSLNRVTPLLVNKQSSGNWGSINGGALDATLAADNPVRMLQEGGRNSSVANRFIGNLNGMYTPVKGLDFNGLISYNNYNYLSSDFINRMDPIINFATGKPIASTAVNVNQLTERWQNITTLLSQLTGSYEKRVNGHFGKLLLGSAYENNLSRSLQIIRKNFVINDLDDIDAGSTDPVNTEVRGAIPGVTPSGIQQYALFSLFTRFNYSYNEKYFFEANFRADESSRFAPGHRWGYYPSFSAAWRISQEDFLRNSNWLSELKLRGSWGKLGNIANVGNYDFFDGLNAGSIGILDQKQQDGVSPGKLGNPVLSWEKVTMTNIGLDAGLFKNKLTVQLDLFNKITNDILLVDESVPDEAGLSSDPNQYPSRNVAQVQNRGIELSLNYNNRIGDFTYSVGGNVAKTKNKILALNTSGTDMITGTYYVNRIGEAVGSFYMFEANGLFVSDEEVAAHATQFSGTKAGDIKYVDQNGDGKIDAADRVIVGNDVPYFTYGLNASLSYKHIDFAFIGQGVSGVKVYLESEASQAFFNGAGVKEYVLGRWTSDNPDPNAAYPRVLRSAANAQNLQRSSFWLFNADYFRIKSLSLGYSLPQPVLDRARLKGLRIYVSSNNPFTIRSDKRLKDFDPESASTRAGYPQLKSYSFGINLTL